MLVVSGLPAPPGESAAFIVRRWDRQAAAAARTRSSSPTRRAASSRRFRAAAVQRRPSHWRSDYAAYGAGLDTRSRALREGEHTASTWPPSLDAPDGPLGSRHFRAQALRRLVRPEGLGDARVGACVKHFQGSARGRRASTDEARVHGVVRAPSGLRRVPRGGRRWAYPCAMVGHAIYPRLGPRRASLEPATYRLLRRPGLRRRRDHRLARRPRQPVRALLGAPRRPRRSDGPAPLPRARATRRGPSTPWYRSRAQGSWTSTSSACWPSAAGSGSF